MKYKSFITALIFVVLIGAIGYLLLQKNVEPKTKEVSSQTNENIVKKLLEDKYGQNKIKTVSVEQTAENHLRGLITFLPLPADVESGKEGEGGIFLVAKVNGEWKLVFDGNGGINCEEIKPYNFPTNMVSDCFSDDKI